MLTTRRTLLLTLLASAVLPHEAPAAAASTGLQLAGVCDDTIDPAPFLVSEKYDGVRGHWDGTTLRHRSGRPVAAPTWFTERLPRGVALDGELWLDRGHFDELSGIVRKRVPVDAEWRSVRYMVFDLPGAAGTFGEREGRLREIVTRVAWGPLVAVEQTRVADRAALQRRLAAVVANGGEGLVLHRASATYRVGRSDALLKLKPELDTEAVVVAHHPGRGRLSGTLGALELRDAAGRRFLVGSGFSDAQRRAPPPIGSVVTYRYRDLTSTGLPRFASFVRVHDAL